MMLRARLRALLRPGAVDRDLAEEMRGHLDRLAAEHEMRGLTPAQARARALREFGPVTQFTEASREARGVAWIFSAGQDLHYGIRLMRRSPGFSSAVVLTVALGIGAMTAMFSDVHGILLRPLPYGEPDRLVNLWSASPSRGLPKVEVGMANVYDWRARTRLFDDIAALRAVANVNLAGNGQIEPERLLAARVSANLFPVLRVSPLLGRTFSEEEDEIGHEQVAILTWPLWQRRFAGDPAIVGRTISLSGVPHTVVGVMRPDFAFPSRAHQILTPLTFDPRELVNRQSYSYLAIGRLKPGVTIAHAQAEMTVIANQLAREHPRENRDIGTIVAPMLGDMVASLRTPLYVLLGAVVTMLLIGCANLANLLLARTLSRQRELTVRAALGAGRGRLAGQAIAELAPMLVAGGSAGLLAAAAAIRTIVPLLPADLPRTENIALSLPVLAFATATLAAIGLFVGVWPALGVSRRGAPIGAADLSRSATGGPARTRRRDVLVIAQIAATLWLAIGAAMLLRSFSALTRVDPGFSAGGVYTVHVAIPRTKYRGDTGVAEFCRQLIARVEAIPGVTAAGLVNRLPLAGGSQTAGLEFEGVPLTAGLGLQADLRAVSPGYFGALRIPLRGGRLLADNDTADRPRVVLIDERIAATVFKGENPLGRRLRVAVPGAAWSEIVGIVGHVRHERVDEEGRPQVYWHFQQNAQDRQAIAVRTAGDPAALAPEIVAAIRAVDPDQPVYDGRTLDAVVDGALAQRRLQTSLLAAFAAVALLLASIGVYGVMAYAVGQRRREFGIRLALGASRAEVMAMVMCKGAVLFACGAAIGLAAAAATARLLAGLLYQMPAFDPLSVTVATLVLFAVATGACGVPARRAAAVDPSVTLRLD
jgi:putative ABC transport system permease protein